MTDPMVRLLERYRARGVLVDANILLLHFVGGYDRDLIARFKRTAQFTVEDYDLLSDLLARFATIVTTPNILAEVNSLSNQIGEPARTDYYTSFAAGITTLDEHYVESADAAQAEPFSKLGLTDSGIMLLASGNYLVLTDDFKLYRFLEDAKIDVINFNHIRPLGWS